MLDDDLLSHGETPHYHRRYIVSLLSSGRDQVVPMLYGRQAIQRETPARLFPGYVIEAVLALSQRYALPFKPIFGRCVFTQITWVLYGQASRAISTG